MLPGSPQGRRSPLITQALDLTRYAFTQRHGDLTVFGTWWHDIDDGWVPCLAIVPTFRMGSDGYKPAVVTVDQAWLWSPETNDDGGAYAGHMAGSFAAALGMPGDAKTGFRIAAIINDHLDDLVKRIPPRPREQQTVMGDVLITNKQTGRERHVEISDDV